MPFVAALSEHPLPTQATGEVLGQVLEAVGERPDLVVLFVTGSHLGALEDIAAAIHSVLRPGAFVGAGAAAVAGGPREVDGQPGIVVWAARFGPARARHLRGRGARGLSADGLDPAALTAASAVLVLADPATFAAGDLVRHLREVRPGLPVVGGMASAGAGPGVNRIVVDGAVHDRGAAAVLLLGGQRLSTIVSQGSRPLGPALAVTKADGATVLEIAGRPALDRLEEAVAGAPEEVRASADRGLQLGVVVDEHKLDFARDDLLLRPVISRDRVAGALELDLDPGLDPAVAVGSIVQFHVHDGAAADEDLRALLAGRQGAAGLLFSGTTRGMRLFGEADHDAELVDAVVEGHALAGMASAGEIGPLGGRSFLHAGSATVALFDEPGGP